MPTTRSTRCRPARRAARHPFALVLLAAAAPLAAGTLHDPQEVHLADVRQLTFGGDNAEAYWSFDGTRLSFQSRRPPLGCDHIFTMPAPEPGEATQVSNGKGRTTCAHYLLGDRRVLYASTDAYTEACPPPPDHSQGYVWPIDPDYELFVSDPDGGNRIRLTENRFYDAEATVCPRDGTLVFTSTRDGDLDLYKMNADGSGIVRLTDTPGYDGGAFFSADCTQIVYRASRPRGEALEDYQRLLAQHLVRPTKLELWVANADGTEARQITDLGVASFAPFFFPDGRRIVFSSNYGDPRGREFDLWAVNVDGTGLERLTFTSGFDGFPMFSPDGKWLAFASNRNQGKPGETDIYVARWVDAPAPAAARVERAADRFAAAAAWLADDAREGRGVGSAGLAAAGAWLEQQFRDIGLAPAGAGGTYRQEFPVTVAVRSGPQTKLSVEGKDIDGESFVPLAFSSTGPVEAEVLAAGFGIVAPEQGIDDYAGLDVTGKVVLVRRFVPSLKIFEEDAELERRLSDLRMKAYTARERGAVGMIVADLESPDPHTEEAKLPRLLPDALGDAGIPAVVVTRAVGVELAGKRVRLQVELVRETASAFNVVGRLDPAPAAPGGGSAAVAADGKAVVVGAHYDHLGRGGSGSLDPDSSEIHNGADDNASGVAALLVAARSVAARRAELARPVVFAAFAAEERGILGSAAMTREPPPGLEPERLAAMINLDMVGRLREQTATVFGTETAAEWNGMLDAICAREQIECKRHGDGYGPSDHTPFYAVGVPVLHLFTGTHGDYHRPSDDAPQLNATGGARMAALTAALAIETASRAEPPSLQAAAAPPAPAGDTRGFGASLGTVPDYAAIEAGVQGVPLAGVRAGGPADQAGIQRGDRIVELDGREIRDLADLMFVLRKATPGRKAKAVVTRGDERIELEVVFGEPRRRN